MHKNVKLSLMLPPCDMEEKICFQTFATEIIDQRSRHLSLGGAGGTFTPQVFTSSVKEARLELMGSWTGLNIGKSFNKIC